MRRAAQALLLAFVMICAADTVLAADGLSLGVNEIRRVALRGVIANVVVANPAIADVTVFDTHSLYVLGRGYGATDVVATDRAGRTLFMARVMVSGPVGGSRVTVHRGAKAVEFSCTARCEQMESKEGSGTAAGASSSGMTIGAPAASPSLSAAPPTSPGV